MIRVARNIFRHPFVRMSRKLGTFAAVSESISFPGEEEKVMKFWEDIQAFQTSLKMSEGKTPYTFYDGPPFATGLPHYGHITAGTLKDVVTRYAHQNGFHVERRFGWDCHGLPIEFEIDKQEGIKTKQDVMKIGIAEYNAKCRSIVMRYSDEWRTRVARLGRWIDFDNDYKTMDLKFMESCWYVFKQLFDKGLVYRSSRVMPYSCGCNTVLSNFEANLNYKEVKDPSVIVNFPVVDSPNTQFLAWTTTPWTLPSNLALAVNPTMTYVKLQPEGSDKTYIFAEPLMPQILKDLKITKYTIHEKVPGASLQGMEYEPLFDYYSNMRETGCFRVYPGEFVTSESGTGIVHCAPFGEEDFGLFVKFGIVRPDNPPDPLDDNGFFNSQAPDLQGTYFKEADPAIKEKLKQRGRLMLASQHAHSYPFCWRSNTPLIYRPVKSWFIKVESIKEQLLQNNNKARWVPAYVQEKRFHNWLQDARDWCFSRNRFWGNPIPLWVSEDLEEVVCIGSIQELKELSGVTEITDLHRESIDHITIPSKQGKGTLRRIEEVFDCWFESGCMPYSQCHYPFSTPEEEFNKRFPADFIAEGLDQTRGWFYTLLVLGTALKNETPFKNLIVNGLVLAEDGSKMSKSKKNFPDPMEVVNKHGADAIRLYLVSSNLVRAEPLKFKEEGVRSTVKEVFLPWYNAYRFFVQNSSRYEAHTGTNYVFDPHSKSVSQNFMDKWITAASQHLIQFMRTEMENYRLYTVVPSLLKFLNDFTNWYVRLNRRRLKGETDLQDWKLALDVLYDALMSLTLLMAPFTPFMTEMIYQNLHRALPEGSEWKAQSVHFVMIPHFNPDLLNEHIEFSVKNMQKVVEIGRVIRERKAIPLKTPVSSFKIIHRSVDYIDSLEPLKSYMKEELNAQDIILEEEDTDNVELSAMPNNPVLGKRLMKKFNKAFRDAVTALTHDELIQYENTHHLVVMGEIMGPGDLLIIRKYKGNDNPALEADGDNDVVVVLDTTVTDELRLLASAREFVTHVQQLRKASKLDIDDQIVVVYSQPGEHFQQVFEKCMESVNSTLKVPVLPHDQKPDESQFISRGELAKDGETIGFELYWRHPKSS